MAATKTLWSNRRYNERTAGTQPEDPDLISTYACCNKPVALSIESPGPSLCIRLSMAAWGPAKSKKLHIATT